MLAPDVCTVFELPKPSVDIEWEKIHEWYVRKVVSGISTYKLQ